jgi:hypothetical protein
MPRRQQRRRPAFRPPPGARSDNAAHQAAVDAGARRLLATHDAAALHSLVQDLRALRDEADRLAFEQPSPQALAGYRRAERELAEAERALALRAGPA